MERRRIILALVVALLLMPSAHAATLCSYKGPDTSEHYLQLTDFLVSGDSPLTVGDKVTASFKLTYVGKEPVTFDDKYGVFVAAKDPDGKTKMFGNTHQGKTLKSGKSVTVETDITLDKEGEWVLWASYCIKGKKETICGPEEWHACQLTVQAKGCPEGCECMTPAQAKELGCELCEGKEIICGYDQYQNPMYCYEKPPTTPSPMGQPDLMILDVWTYGDVPGVYSEIRYMIQNVGDGPAGPSTTALYIDGHKVVEHSITDLGPGESRVEHVPFEGVCSGSSDEFTAKADVYDVVVESDETNNKYSRTYPCPAEINLPDLVLIDVWHEGEVGYYYTNREYTMENNIRFSLRNSGNASSPSTEARLYIDGVWVSTSSIPSLDVGEIHQGSFSYIAACSGTSDVIRVVVDPLDHITEVGEANNELTEEWNCFWFSISGTIHNFWHDPRTLKVKICEAETIGISPSSGFPRPLAMTQCKEGGNVWYADVTQEFVWDLPSGDLYYSLGGLCPGEYIVAPVRSPIHGLTICEWQGSWQAAKGQVVRIENSNVEGVDFTFEPLDSSAPMIPSIVTEPEHPKLNEDVTVTILAEDDQEIVSICERTDMVDMNGIFHPGRWCGLNVTPGLEGSTAGAQFSITNDQIMKATVRVMVCDVGGNSRLNQKIILFGSCDDGIQDQGETGVDCGGPCPSLCMDCLGDSTIGNCPSAYLYSPGEIDDVRLWAEIALYHYADHLRDEHGIDITADDLDTSDEYIEAISWWVAKTMGYRGDGLNRKCLNDIRELHYDPSDYGHLDFPQPAYYTLLHSGRCPSFTYTEDGKTKTWHPDPTKTFYGDCEDFGILEAALLRSLGVSHRCIFCAEEPGHSFNIVYYKGKYRVLEPQLMNAIGRKYYSPHNLWNDEIGAFVCTNFDKVKPWEYAMNYPGCENPWVSVSGGGFGDKQLWLDWNGWGENVQPGVADHNGDGKDDVAAVRLTRERYSEFWFNSDGDGFVKDFAEPATGDSDDLEFYVIPVDGRRVRAIRGTVMGNTGRVYRYGHVESPDSINMVKFQRSEGVEELEGNVYVSYDWARKPKIYLETGNLKMVVSDLVAYDHWNNVDRAPQLQYSVGPGDWSMETRVRLSDGGGTHHAGLMVYFSENDIIYWGPYNAGSGECLRIERSGKKSLGETGLSGYPVHLKITKRGTEYDFFYKARTYDDWTLLKTLSVDETPTKVGLILKTWTPTAITASFSHFDFSNGSTTFSDDFDGVSLDRRWRVYIPNPKWHGDFCREDQIPFVGDFDGDGTDDIIRFKRAEGDVFVALSRPEKTRFGHGLLWHDNFCLDGETPLVGDFNGDGRDDIVTFKQDTGHVFVALSTKFGFWGDGWLWKYNFCYEGDTPLVGDFNGDGRDDIACLSVEDGRAKIWVALAAPSTITYNCHGGNICEQAPFYTKAYWPDICR